MFNELAKLKPGQTVSLYLRGGHSVSGKVFEMDTHNYQVITVIDDRARSIVVDMRAVDAIRIG